MLSAYNSAANRVTSYTYDAWGNALSTNETSSFANNPIRYSGQYYDYESGMTYLRARYYDSGVRRFISEDTHWNVDNMIYGDAEGENTISNDIIHAFEIMYGIRTDGLVYNAKKVDCPSILQSTNLYAYALNNPLKYMDNDGQSIIAVSAAMAEAMQFIFGAALAVGAVYILHKAFDNITEQRKNHILHGSGNKHESGWKKFNINPNDPNDFEKLIPIINEVLKNGTQTDSRDYQDIVIKTFEYYFDRVGETVKVIINVTKDGIESLSDAYVRFK